MDSESKQKFRSIVAEEPLWGKSSDAMTTVLFPYAFRKVGNKLSAFARYILWVLIQFNRTIIQLPRYHAKSTVITFLYVMWCILARRKKYILILSSTGNQAVKFLMRIRFYLQSKKVKLYYGDIARAVAIKDTENESFDYIETEGKKRSRVWNYKEIYIEPWGIRIMASSIKSANRGLLSIDDRPDLIIFDDVEDRKNTNTLELRQKLIEDIFEEIIPAGETDCQFIAIGTICHYGSYLLKLRKEDSGWYKVPIERSTDTIENILALNDILPEEMLKAGYKFDPKQEYFESDRQGTDGEYYKKGDKTPEVALWQGVYTYEYFCDKWQESKSVGVLPSFWQERYNIPKTNESRVFTEFKFVQDLEPKWLYGELILESTGVFTFPNGKKICNVLSFTAGDLAISTQTSADWRVFGHAFTDPWGNVYVMLPWRNKEPDPFDLGKWILAEHKKYQFQSGTFDGQHFQKWFGNVLKYLTFHEKDENGKARYSKLKVYQEPRSEQKEDVIAGKIAPYISSGKLHFIGKSEDWRIVTDELMYLGFFDTDDCADWLSYLCSHLKFPAYIDFDQVKPVSKSVANQWYDDIPIEKRAWLS